MLVSCISTKHSLLKQHWRMADALAAAPSGLAVRGSARKPDADLGGHVCRLDAQGRVVETVEVYMPAGLWRNGDEILVAGRYGCHSFSLDLAQHNPARFSSPLFNALHSIRPTQRGFLITSTGLDLILEVDGVGRPIWEWWAMDHGYTTTPTGAVRVLDRAADHRHIEYGTLMQTTHVNSALELPDGRILASLFHQHMVVAIERESGRATPVLTDLPHVHAVRLVDDRYITVADTGHGRALLVNTDTWRADVVLPLDTAWLQDCQFDPEQDRWILVYGDRSTVVVIEGKDGMGPRHCYPLDPEWRLYEVLSLN